MSNNHLFLSAIHSSLLHFGPTFTTLSSRPTQSPLYHSTKHNHQFLFLPEAVCDCPQDNAFHRLKWHWVGRGGRGRWGRGVHWFMEDTVSSFLVQMMTQRQGMSHRKDHVLYWLMNDMVSSFWVDMRMQRQRHDYICNELFPSTEYHSIISACLQALEVGGGG